MPSYQPVAFQSPGFDYGTDLSQIERRRQMAQMLQKEGMQPIQEQPVAPGQFAVPISPFQGAAKMAQILAASRQQSKADKQQRDLAQTSQSNLASVLMNAQKAAAGTPGTSLSEDASGNVTPAQPAVPGDIGKAAGVYMQDPRTQQLGIGMQQQAMAKQLREQEIAAIQNMGQGQQPAYGAPGFSPQGQGGGGMGGIPPQALAAMLSQDTAIQGVGKHLASRGETSGRVFYDQNNNAYTIDKSGHRINIEGTRQGISPADQYKIPLQQAETYFNTGLRPGALGQQPMAPTAPQPQAPQIPAPQAQAPAATVPNAPAPSASAPLQITPKQRAQLEAERPQAQFAATSILDGLGRGVEQIDKLLAAEGLPNITGPIAGRTPNISGAATNAQAQLDTLKSMISVQELQRMRDASKTGGAVGSVTEKEWPRLEGQLGALQQAQTTGEFRKALGEVKETMQRMQDNARRAYETTYGRLNYTKPARSQDTPKPPSRRIRFEEL